jgi:hypothetical protein
VKGQLLMAIVILLMKKTLCTATLGKVWQLHINLNIYVVYNEAIPLIGIYPREMKTDIHNKTDMQMFIKALFVITKNGNNPSVPQWVRDASVQRTDYRLLSRAATWMDFKDILPNEKLHNGNYRKFLKK